MKMITVKVTPVQGKGASHEVDATHSTVAAALAAAGVEFGNGLQVTVNDEPADLKHAVTEGDTIAVTEKVRGS